MSPPFASRSGGVKIHARRPARTVVRLGAVGLIAFGVTLLDSFGWRGAHHDDADARQLVEKLLLTDLALFTEARYTRHITQADRHTPFQDHPVALEHFPSGSLVQPARIPTHDATSEGDDVPVD